MTHRTHSVKLTGNTMIPPTVPEGLERDTGIPTDVIVLGKLVPELRNAPP